jgi:hypothetical protein
MRYLNAIVVVAALAAVGCADEEQGARGTIDGTDGSTTQKEFDLTYDDHRAQFETVDKIFHSALGPYAIYEITGDNPHLIGPTIMYDPYLGDHAMLCSSGGHFAPTPYAADVEGSLTNQFSDAIKYVTANMPARAFGDCVQPKDDFGEPIPPGDNDPPTSPPPNNPPDEPPSEPPTSDPPEVPGGEPPPGGEEVPVLKSASINVQISDSTIGALVLLRRVAVGIEEQHNNSHVLPDICCDGAQCDLMYIE